MKKNLWISIVIVFIIGLGLIGLYVFQNITTTPIFVTSIGKIISNPRPYEDKVVNVYGEVTEKKSFLLVKYFKLKDKTGEIVVITKKVIPSIGVKIKVKGKVEESFSIGDYQLLVIIEERQN